MNIGPFIFNLPRDGKHAVRKMENTNSKINKVKTSLVFNQTCNIEKLLPTYTDISIYEHIL